MGIADASLRSSPLGPPARETYKLPDGEDVRMPCEAVVCYT